MPPLTGISPDTGDSSTDRVTSATTNVTFSGTADANSTVTVSAPPAPGNTGMRQLTTTANGSGNWSLLVAAVADGVWNVQVMASDAAGNASAWSGNYPTTINSAISGVSFTINGGAVYANANAVSLSTASTNLAPLTWMQFSNDNTGVWSGWEAYSTPKAWTMSATPGTRAVKAQFKDLAGNVSGVYQDTIILDITPPNPVVTTSAPNPTSVSPIPFDVDFGESVTGFTATDITVTNGAVTSVTGGPRFYSFGVTPVSNNTLVEVSMASAVASDIAGNASTASNVLDIQYVNEQPTCTVSGPSSPTKDNPIRFTIVFGNTVTGLTAGAVVVSDSVGSNTSGVLGGAAGGTTYTLDVVPRADGTVTCQVPAGVATRTDSNNEPNQASNLLTLTSDQTKPNCTVSGPASPTKDNPIVFTLTFTEPVTAPVAGNVTVTGGVKGAVVGATGGLVYTIPVVPSGQNAVTCQVNAGAVLDMAGNSGNASNTLSITYDSVHPTLTSITGPTSPTKNNPMVYALVFSEPVTGLASPDDFTVTNGTASTLGGSGTSYTLNVIPTADGPVSFTVKQDAAFDAAGNGSIAADSTAITYDQTHPTCVLSFPATATNVSPILFTATFSEPVTLSGPGSAVATNGTVGTITGSGTTYTVPVTPTSGYQGLVTLAVQADTGHDAALNGNTASNALSVTYDTVLPGCTVSSTPAIPNSDPIFTLTFTEPVLGLSASGLTVTNGTALAPVPAGDGTVWTVEVLPAGQGDVSCQVKAGAAHDPAQNGNTVSNTVTVLYDSVAPTCTVTGPAEPISTLPLAITITFSEDVTGFDAGHVTLGGCVGSGFVALNGHQYALNLLPTGSGTVSCSVAADQGFDHANNGNTASSPSYSVSYTAINPICTISTARAVAINESPIIFTLSFNEPVTGLTESGITVSGGTKGALGGGPNVYTIPVSNVSSQATATVSVAAGAATSVSAGKPNLAATYSVVYDPIAPGVTVSAVTSSPTNATTVTFVLTFTENVTDLTSGEVAVTNGTVSFMDSGPRVYTVDVVPSGTGDVTCQVPAAAAIDRAANPNTVSNTAVIAYDGTAPTCVVSHVGAGGLVATKDNPIPFTLTFSKDVTGLGLDDITVTNGSKGLLSGGPSVYTLLVAPSANGPVTCQVAASAVVDHVGNANPASNQLSLIYDSAAPPCVVSGAASTNANPVVFTLTFPEDVSTPDVAGITVTGGTKGAVSGGPRVFTLPVATVQGTQVSVTCQVGAGACADLAGNANLASNVASISHDSVRPVCTVTGPASPTKNNPIVFMLTFSKPVTGLTSGGITVTGGTIDTVSGIGTTWMVGVLPGADGPVTCLVKDGAAQDALGNTNPLSNQLSLVYDSTRPTCVVTAPAGLSTGDSPITFTAVFSEPVTGLALGDFALTNAIAGALTGSGTSYSLTVTPKRMGAVTCTVPESSAADAALNGNEASNTASISYTNPDPACWIETPVSPTANVPIVFTINFGQPVTGLTMDEIVVGNATKQTLSGSGAVYTLSVTMVPGVETTVTCQVPAGVASSLDGPNRASLVASVLYDQTPPTAVVSPVAVAPTAANSVQYTVVFNEAVASFTASDVLVNRGTLAGTVASVTGAGPGYTVTVQLADGNQNGTVGITIPAGVVTDLVGFAYAGDSTSALTTVYNWPGFGASPSGGKLYAGDSFSHLSVTVAAGGVPTSYQWKHDTGAKALLDGPTTPAWPLTNITSAAAGSYWCEVTFDGTVYASSTVTLEVQPRVAVTSPVGGSVQPGSDWSFTVVASGGYPFAAPAAPYSYQWKKNDVNIPGAPDGPTLDLPGLVIKDSGYYRVEVSDSNGDTQLSDAAKLTVITPVPVLGLGGMALLAAALAGAAARRRRD